MKEKDQRTIIEILNENLKSEALKDTPLYTVESIAESVGVSKKTLYRWLETDVEFARDLGRLQESKRLIKEKFPDLQFTEEDGVSESTLDAMMIALIIIQKKQRES